MFKFTPYKNPPKTQQNKWILQLLLYQDPDTIGESQEVGDVIQVDYIHVFVLKNAIFEIFANRLVEIFENINFRELGQNRRNRMA